MEGVHCLYYHTSKDCAYQSRTLCMEGISPSPSGKLLSSWTLCASRIGSSSARNCDALKSVPVIATGYVNPKKVRCYVSIATSRLGNGEPATKLDEHEPIELLGGQKRVCTNQWRGPSRTAPSGASSRRSRGSSHSA